jgi:hypothetical protein
MIEARWLFGIEPERVDVLIHPQSIVHAIVECCGLARCWPSSRVPTCGSRSSTRCAIPNAGSRAARARPRRARARSTFEPPTPPAVRVSRSRGRALAKRRDGSRRAECRGRGGGAALPPTAIGSGTHDARDEVLGRAPSRARLTLESIRAADRWARARLPTPRVAGREGERTSRSGAGRDHAGGEQGAQPRRRPARERSSRSSRHGRRFGRGRGGPRPGPLLVSGAPPASRREAPS